MSQNFKYHTEIRKWNTEQLIHVLELNGLSDCSEAIQNLDIDGEAFLNLTEGQLAFWRKYLNHVQVRRLWSIIQLARERPKDFVGDVGNILKPASQQEIDRIRWPIAHSLANILGQKPGSIPSNNAKQEVLQDYQNNETILQTHGKPPYKNLPPKPGFLIPKQQSQDSKQPELRPQQQQQQPNIRNAPVEEDLPMKPTEKEKQIFHIRHPPPIPVQHEQISQNPEVNVMKQEEVKSNSFLHQNVRVLPHSATNEFNTTNRYHRVPSPKLSRPLPVPPKPEITFPLPPIAVPIIPDWKIDDDEDYTDPRYDEVEYYKTKQWYSEINRKQANELLKGKPNGTFIARPSKQENYECSLSIVYNYRVYNLGIIKRNHQLVIGNQEFNSVNEIIEYFMEYDMVLNGDNNEDIVVKLRQI